MHQRDKIRSLPLGSLATLLMRDDVEWVSLQKGAPVAELASPFAAHVLNLDSQLQDFSDTAVAIAGLDLVITVDTSVAHLAGGLGVPTWVLLPSVPDWRWMLERTDSPWYPTMRLFRQAQRGDWASVVGRVSMALDAFIASAPDKGATSAQRAPTAASAVVPTSRRPIEIGWPVGLTSGWGTYGLQLALALADSERAVPVLGEGPITDGLGPVVELRLREIARAARPIGAPTSVRLSGLGNGAQGAPRIGQRPAAREVGVIFFEDTAFGADAVARANAYDRIIAGSTWNAELLKAFGVERVRLVLQGVDPTLFHPWPKRGLLGDRFCVFSGGKLEFRKGQDIVVEAFRRFQATHPDALLVTAWHNHWPQTMAGIDAMGYVRGTPEVRDGRCDVTSWLVANGIPRDAVLDLGVQSQATIAPILREMDVAVFPNRAEGGTNLVAMETMASGVPTILSRNTGHLNLIGRDTCFSLDHQAPVTTPCALYHGMFSWGESDPDEIVAHLERAYDDRADAARRGAAGAALLAQLPWSRQANALLDALDD